MEKKTIDIDPNVIPVEIDIDSLREDVKEKVKAKRSVAFSSAKMQAYSAIMASVERSLSDRTGVQSSSTFSIDNPAAAPSPTNSRSSEEISVPLFFSDFQYDIGQGPDDDFLYEELYKKDPYIATALEIHSEIPVSKMRMGLPNSKHVPISQMVYDFFDEMVQEMDPSLSVLLQEILLDWDMKGRVGVWFRWSQETRKWVSATIITPFVRTEIPPFGGKRKIFLKINSLTKSNFFEWMTKTGAPPETIKEMEAFFNVDTQEIELNTDPYKGSFCYYSTRRARQSAPDGISQLSRLKRVARYRSKLMSIQEVILTRNMFAKHLIFADTDQQEQLEELRADIAISNINPDYEIITNYKVEWQTVTTKERLLDLGTEWTETEKQYNVGLNMPMTLLTGDGQYENQRISIELMNTRYSLKREMIRDLVENKLFKPVSFANNFYERDDTKESLLEDFWKRDEDPLNFTDIIPDGSLDPKVVDVRQRIRLFREKYEDPKFTDELSAGLARIGRALELEKSANEKKEILEQELEQVKEKLSSVTGKITLSRVKTRIRELKDILSASSMLPMLSSWDGVVGKMEELLNDTLAANMRRVLVQSKIDPDSLEQMVGAVEKMEASPTKDEDTKKFLNRIGMKIRSLSKRNLLKDPTIRFIYPKVSFKRVSISDPAEAFSQLYNLFTTQGLPLGPLLDLFDLDEKQVEQSLKNNFLTPKQSGQQELVNNLYAEVGRNLADNPQIIKTIVENFGLNKNVQDAVLSKIDGLNEEGKE